MMLSIPRHLYTMNEEQAIFDLLFAILLFSLLSQTLNADPQRGGQTLKRNPQQLWQTLNMFDLPELDSLAVTILL